MQTVSLAHLPNLAADVLARLSAQGQKERATILALRGDLGAGKTTFVQALAKQLGIQGSVVSPTYVLMKSYPILGNAHFLRLVHIDAYRLESPEEFAALRPEEFLSDPKALVVVEWPEKVGGALPQADVAVDFSSQGASEGERYIEVV